jgi:hypothetical protein
MFIEEYPDLVAPDLCEQIVALFESDSRKKPSVTTAGRVSIRTGTQLNPKPHASAEWKRLMMEVKPAIVEAMRLYALKHENMRRLLEAEKLSYTPPMIERVNPEEGFGWHYDHMFDTPTRVVAGLLYLRTIQKGGETMFLEQQHGIPPVAGKIAMFPPFWTHVHQGVTPVSEPKYVLSYFWVYAAGTQPLS